MKVTGEAAYRKVFYGLSLPSIGVPYVAEVEAHFHRPGNRHAHDETQVIAMLAGSMRVTAGGQEIIARAGDAWIMPPKVSHFVGPGDGAAGTVYIDARFAPSAGPIHTLLCSEGKLVVRSTGLEALAQTARQLSSAVRSSGPGQSAHVMAILWQMMAELSATAEPVIATGIPTGTATTDAPDVDRRLLAAERYMMNRLNRDISVDDLAEVSGLSRSQLCRLYAKSFRQSPAARLRHLRIEQAQHLLQHSTLSVKEVAHVCGFSCPNHFSRVYHGLTGKTPTDGRSN